MTGNPAPNATPVNSDQRFSEAETLAAEILRHDPNDVGALHALGLVRLQEGELDEAIDLFERTVAAMPEGTDVAKVMTAALNKRSKLAVDRRDFRKARRDLKRATQISPGRADVRAHFAFVLSQTGEFDASIVEAKVALSLAPDNGEALNAQGLALRGLERDGEAIDVFRTAIEKSPEVAALRVNLGSALAGEGDKAAALEQFREAIRLEPDNIQGLNNLGNALADRLEFTEGEAMLRRAVELDPAFAEAHFNLAMLLLIQGKFDEGWVEYEWRWKCPKFPSTRRQFDYPVWQGESLTGKTILIWSEQGVGDEIMFANPLPDVAAEAEQMVLECNPRFVQIFERSNPGAIVTARKNPPDPEIAASAPDYQLSMASLCVHYRRRRENFPIAPGYYLRANPKLTAVCRARYDALGGGLKVGISWRSGNPAVGCERSADLLLWDDILAQPGCHFINLQYGEVANDLSGASDRLGINVFVDEEIDPFASMDNWLAQVAAMDLIISVDNSTVQVSGALGIPTWTLLSYAPEWRWLAEGNDSPWHPKMQVIRQPSPGEWPPVFVEAADRLQRLCARDLVAR